MVGEEREEHCCREGGEGAHVAHPGWHERIAEEGDYHCYVGWTEELEQVCCEVLVVWVEAMDC